MKKAAIILLWIFISTSISAQIDTAIRAYVSDTVFRNAGISICIRDMESGEILAGHNENMALTSASVMKLVTTGTILELLGPDKVFGTKLVYAGSLQNGILEGYLVIEGGGDPALGSGYFKDHYGSFLDSWVRLVKEAGIKHIKGRVMAETYIFSNQPVAPGWSWSDIGNYYGAGVHGVNVFDNMYRIFFSTGNEGSSPEILGVDPEIPGLEIESLLKASGNSDNGYVYLEPYGKHAIIRGTIPVNRDTFALKASIPDPPLLLASMLHNKLTDSGITISMAPSTSRQMPGYMTDSLLSTLKYIQLEYSPSLGEIIKVTNLESVNLFAETLAWTLDNQLNQRMYAKLNGGLDIIYDFLESRNISQGLYMTDGSGLSRSNAMSSSFITNYLVYMGRDASYSETFRASLARPGEGTLEAYFLSPELKENIVAKSGTVKRVRNYAGYIKSKSGRELCFGVLTNNFDCSSHQVSKRVEELMLEVYRSF
ncbi:MAG: D-alanyl-D-alanine carboxypeptidase/D-alanyl-D-alanine-endopeptidase [Marinilabiliaceae bacterium]|jgi:D-alanyl-D-alanine carboxypeptidase/D-alanyl-D-alanine-endopeptidase (penicillin-binding protein 4)|nr:D-alanyl-D-alanine carboxypeptidase/D-alanyl-D-alanine-endopeptidase [Marinilabiliaceae bacterium]